MSRDSALAALLPLIRPERLVRYAEACGWIRISNKRQDVAVLNAPPGVPQFMQVVVPLSPEADDFSDRVWKAVQRLAISERKGEEQVIAVLLAEATDVLRIRVDQADTRDGAVPLSQGIDLLKAAEKSIRSAACSVEESRGFHPRLSRPTVDQLIERSRLGQTERGSFIITIMVPLDAVLADDASQMRMFDDDFGQPFARKTTSYLMNSVSHVAQALERDAVESLATPAPSGIIVTANLCEALLDMKPPGARGSVNVAIDWERTIPAPEGTPRFVHLPPIVFDRLERAIQVLKPLSEPKESVFIGTVIGLMGTPDQDGLMWGEVMLQVQAGDELLKTKVSLPRDEHLAACDAYKARKYISVAGTLVRHARIHEIVDPRDFRVL